MSERYFIHVCGNRWLWKGSRRENKNLGRRFCWLVTNHKASWTFTHILCSALFLEAVCTWHISAGSALPFGGFIKPRVGGSGNMWLQHVVGVHKEGQPGSSKLGSSLKSRCNSQQKWKLSVGYILMTEWAGTHNVNWLSSNKYLLNAFSVPSSNYPLGWLLAGVVWANTMWMAMCLPDPMLPQWRWDWEMGLSL